MGYGSGVCWVLRGVCLRGIACVVLGAARGVFLLLREVCAEFCVWRVAYFWFCACRVLRVACGVYLVLRVSGAACGVWRVFFVRRGVCWEVCVVRAGSVSF